MNVEQELGGGKVRVASKSLLAFGIVVYTWWQLGRMAGPNVGRHGGQLTTYGTVQSEGSSWTAFSRLGTGSSGA